MPQSAAAVVNPRTAGVLARQLPTSTANTAIAKTAAPQVFIPLHWKLAVGGVAGVVGVSATFPIDIVKTQLQGQTRTTSGKVFFTGPIHCFRHILKTDGVRGLYRGLPPTLVGVLPEKAIKLAVNEQLREYLADENGKLPLSRQVLAGAGAGLAQVVATNPVRPLHALFFLLCVYSSSLSLSLSLFRLKSSRSVYRPRRRCRQPSD